MRSQLRAVKKLLDLKTMGLPHSDYAGSEVSRYVRYGEEWIRLHMRVRISLPMRVQFRLPKRVRSR